MKNYHCLRLPIQKLRDQFKINRKYAQWDIWYPKVWRLQWANFYQNDDEDDQEDGDEDEVSCKNEVEGESNHDGEGEHEHEDSD